MLDTLDIPAWVSYSALFLFGVVTSFAGVRKAWSPYAPVWSLTETWALFVGQAFLPLLLLWLLDLLRVLHDTSLAGVAIIAAGYLAIIETGQFEGATAAQQSGLKHASSWLKPFVRWLEAIRAHQSQRAAQREREIRHLVRTQVRKEKGGSKLKELKQLADYLSSSADRAALEKTLADYKKNPEPLHQLGIDPLDAEIELLLDAVLRHPDGEEELAQRGFSLNGPNRFSLRRLARLVPPLLLLLLMLYIIAPTPFNCLWHTECRASAWASFTFAERATAYSLFRLTKTWTTDDDLARNEKYIIDQLVAGDTSDEKKRVIVQDLVWALQSPTLPAGRDRLIVRILFRSYVGDGSGLCKLGKSLVAALYTPRDDVRDNVHAELIRLARRLDAADVDTREKSWQVAKTSSPGFLNEAVADWEKLFESLCQRKSDPIAPKQEQ